MLLDSQQTKVGKGDRARLMGRFGAERFMTLLRSNRSFQSQVKRDRWMDRGEIEVEEERQVRTKRVPVLPTHKEKGGEVLP